ncbi:MAG: hypothetical protein ATN36_02360 [Epulopiscium sp. Nele67-Bin005]|nr:MAG: hypothetical protein ATN36_02360 [Epulopiscium sp. Nele67-Bin005]
MKILVPISNALKKDDLLSIQEVALKKNAKIIILYITSPLTFSSCYAYPSLLYSMANLNMDTIDTAHHAITAKLHSIFSRCEHEVICLIGPQTDTILSVANQKKADIIALPNESGFLDKITHQSYKNKLAKKTSVKILLYNEL